MTHAPDTSRDPRLGHPGEDGMPGRPTPAPAATVRIVRAGQVLEQAPGGLLLIDSGNSRVKWRWHGSAGGDGPNDGVFSRFAEAATLSAPAPRLCEPAWRDRAAPRAIWISNVAGAAAAAHLDALLETHFPGTPRHTIRAGARQCGVINGYVQPRQLGSDRWASLIGARHTFPGEHLLIATLGTATTVEALDVNGRFSGGLIAPGWDMMMGALGMGAAQLPSLSVDTGHALLRELLADAASDGASGAAHTTRSGATSDTNPHAAPDAPPNTAPATRAFARDTPHALAAGCLLAQTGLIERAWREHRAAQGGAVRLIVGGGGAHCVAPTLHVPYTRHDGLVLAGLAVIAASEERPNEAPG